MAEQETTAERWLPVVGWEDLYEVSDQGRVRRIGPGMGARVGKTLKASPDAWGYPRVALSRNGRVVYRKVHTLALVAFVGPCPEGMLCRHLDGDRAKSALSNIRWGTPAENNEDMARHGRATQGERQPNHRLTKDDVLFLRASSLSNSDAAERFGVALRTIRDARNGSTWGWL